MFGLPSKFANYKYDLLMLDILDGIWISEFFVKTKNFLLKAASEEIKSIHKLTFLKAQEMMEEKKDVLLKILNLLTQYDEILQSSNIFIAYWKKEQSKHPDYVCRA